MIGFNKPYFTGNEIGYILEAVRREKISGNGYFTQRCQNFIEKRYGVPKVLLTSSCTDALEMAALLLDIKPGDEVIIPSYTFVSTANAFVLRGANIVFADSGKNDPNIDVNEIEKLITPKTRVIVLVHYGGFSCDIEMVMAIATKHNIFVVEDAAQAIESTYRAKPLGSFGQLACFSFHETKNIISGEGGALLINDTAFINRAEIIWEKGTNRSAFFRGEIDKYGWVDIGSSFLPSEIMAAFLWAQLEEIDEIQDQRHLLWNKYYNDLNHLENEGAILLPKAPVFNHHNSHIFYLLTRSEEERDQLLSYLNTNGVNAIFHYLPLHKSKFYTSKYNGKELSNCERFASTLVRLPLYFELGAQDVNFITENIKAFYASAR